MRHRRCSAISGLHKSGLTQRLFKKACQLGVSIRYARSLVSQRLDHIPQVQKGSVNTLSFFHPCSFSSTLGDSLTSRQIHQIKLAWGKKKYVQCCLLVASQLLNMLRCSYKKTGWYTVLIDLTRRPDVETIAEHFCFVEIHMLAKKRKEKKIVWK